MIKASVVIGLLKSLETYVTRLESLKPASLNEWNQDFTNYWAALHGLQVAVQHDEYLRWEGVI
jgi:hypothetical protein